MGDGWNGLGVGLSNLWRLADAETRSISPENPDGAKGRGGMATEGTAPDHAGELGQGWKISPFVRIARRARSTSSPTSTAPAPSSTSG